MAFVSDRDGRPDLLLGDYTMQKPDLPEPTAEEKAEHDKIRAERTKFGGEAISDVKRNAEAGSHDRHAKSERGNRKEFAARAACDGVGDESYEHSTPLTNGPKEHPKIIWGPR